LRGSDIDYNPVFFSYALVTKTDVFLYINQEKVNDEVRQSLEAAGVTIRDYEAIFSDVKEHDNKIQAVGASEVSLKHRI
jgi:Xaa-Pro aminopeptidase